MSTDALRQIFQIFARLRRRPQAWIGALVAAVGMLAACQVGLIPVSLTRAETGELVSAADWADAGRQAVYHPRVVADVAGSVPPPSPIIPPDVSATDHVSSKPHIGTPTESPLEPLTEPLTEPPVTPFRPVPATAPVERDNIAMTGDPQATAPAPIPAPPFTTSPLAPRPSPLAPPSLAASAVWPRLRGDGPVRAVAVVFLGVDCPVSAAALPRLSRVHATWGELGVRLVGIVVGAQVTPAAATEFRAAHRLRFPVMTDRSGALQQLLSPTHTPQVFVLRPDGEVAYRGRIDDDGLPPGQAVPGPRRVHVEEALAAVIAGRTPPVSRTAPVGRPLSPPGAGGGGVASVTPITTTTQPAPATEPAPRAASGWRSR